MDANDARTAIERKQILLLIREKNAEFESEITQRNDIYTHPTVSARGLSQQRRFQFKRMMECSW